MKLIFLDIDGVLNSRAWWGQGYYRHIPWPDNQFDPQAVKRLNDLLDRSGASVVLSSAWRSETARDANWLLGRVGVRRRCVVGVTPRFEGKDRHSPRGEEIAAYLVLLGQRQPERFVILDDYDDMAHLGDHLVKTDPEMWSERSSCWTDDRWRELPSRHYQDWSRR